MTHENCLALFDRIQSAARARGITDVEVSIAAGDEALTRFANNVIHQNVAESARHVSVRVIVDGRTARASTNRTSDDALVMVVERAIAIARAAEPDPHLLPLADASPVDPVDRWAESTAAATPEDRAKEVAAALRETSSAAGIYSTEEAHHALLNSRGLAVFHRETMATFSITALEGDSSGWAKASAVNRSDLDPGALASRAQEKARMSAKPREIAPGAYTVILEPAAVLDLVGQIFGDFSATAVEDQRSFLNDRLGKALFGANIQIHDDVYHPLQAGAPFDGEGVSRRRVTLVENGAPANLVYSRGAAERAGCAPTGHGFPLPNELGEAPVNIVIGGGDTSVEQMIAATARGVLVTRLWYIREVDPYEKIMTGMTRDGTFWVEDGKIRFGVKNFRFNQSVIEMLNNVEALGPSVRASGEEAFDMAAPPMKIRDFRFTELTTF